MEYNLAGLTSKRRQRLMRTKNTFFLTAIVWATVYTSLCAASQQLNSENYETVSANTKNLQAALKEAEKLDPSGTTVAQIATDLGTVYREQKNYREAELLYNRALAIWQRRLDPSNPLLAKGLYNLGRLYQLEGRDAETEPLF